MTHHAPTRSLTPDEAEDRRDRCGACGLAIGHVDEQGRVWGPDADRTCYRLVEAGSRWSGETYFEQSLLDAAGPDFCREACCLQRYGVLTVGELAPLVRAKDPVLDRLNMTISKKDRPMIVRRPRLQALCVRLLAAQAEFIEWRTKQ